MLTLKLKTITLEKPFKGGAERASFTVPMREELVPLFTLRKLKAERTVRPDPPLTLWGTGSKWEKPLKKCGGGFSRKQNDELRSAASHVPLHSRQKCVRHARGQAMGVPQSKSVEWRAGQPRQRGKSTGCTNASVWRPDVREELNAIKFPVAAAPCACCSPDDSPARPPTERRGERKSSQTHHSEDGTKAA